MTLDDLITELREDYLEDPVEPYQWSDTKLMRYLNEAIQEACYRAPLYQETQTITVASGTATYTLDPEVRQIDRVTLAAVTDPLVQYSEEEMTTRFGLAWRETTGTPYAFVRKETEITLYPEPIAADTLSVLHFRLPNRLYATSEEPPIPEEHHRQLLNWCAYKAFINPDIDQGNPERAMSFYGLFEKHFGPRKSARTEHLRLNTPKYAQVLPYRIA